MVFQSLRSLVFWILFIGQTAILAIPVGLMSRLAPKSVPWWIVEYWFNSSLFFLRWVAGVGSEVTGAENIPDEGCLIVSKHQSDWEILALLRVISKPAFIAKKELLDIPFFGWAARRFETIRLDRARGGDAIPQMIEGAREALARGCHVIIFPEGTRKKPLAPADYRWGTAKLYTALGVPVVPVALNSGLYWPARSLTLWPGRARAKILKPIPPGLSLEAFHTLMVETIERESDAMILADLEAGIAGPMSAEMIARLAASRAPTTSGGVS